MGQPVFLIFCAFVFSAPVAAADLPPTFTDAALAQKSKSPTLPQWAEWFEPSHVESIAKRPFHSIMIAADSKHHQWGSDELTPFARTVFRHQLQGTKKEEVARQSQLYVSKTRPQLLKAASNTDTTVDAWMRTNRKAILEALKGFPQEKQDAFRRLYGYAYHGEDPTVEFIMAASLANSGFEVELDAIPDFESVRAKFLLGELDDYFKAVAPALAGLEMGPWDFYECTLRAEKDLESFLGPQTAQQGIDLCGGRLAAGEIYYTARQVVSVREDLGEMTMEQKEGLTSLEFERRFVRRLIEKASRPPATPYGLHFLSSGQVGIAPGFPANGFNNGGGSSSVGRSMNW